MSEIGATRFLFRAESHLRNQMFLLHSLGVNDARTTDLVDAIRILFEAGWRVIP